jgi:hypothetical protein
MLSGDVSRQSGLKANKGVFQHLDRGAVRVEVCTILYITVQLVDIFGRS